MTANQQAARENMAGALTAAETEFLRQANDPALLPELLARIDRAGELPGFLEVVSNLDTERRTRHGGG